MDKVEFLCGDSLQIVPSLGEFDVVITDPPYAAGATKREWRSGGRVEAILYESAKHVKKDGTMLVFSASSGRSVDRICSVIVPTLPLARVLVWTKPHSRCAAAGPFGWQSVLILMFGKNGGPSRAPDNITCEARRYKRDKTTPHPAELPSEVCRWLATGLKDRLQGATVLDPFAGTGRLLTAAAGVGAARCTGIEINPDWVVLAEKLYRDEREEVRDAS